MSHATEFNAAAAARIEALYQTPDVAGQRVKTLAALALAPAERVLDIGAGPGLLLLDMAKLVGPKGRAAGIDTSPDMIRLAAQRLEGLPQAELHQADALALPFGANAFDAVVSVQVFEYVAEIETTLSECARVLCPGGRIAIIDTDYDSLVLSSGDETLTKRVLQAWDEHFVHRDLPRRLPVLLRAAGFAAIAVETIPMLSWHWQAHTYAFGILQMMARFGAGRQGLSRDDCERWLSGLEALGAEGRFFFSLNRYLVTARKPASAGQAERP